MLLQPRNLFDIKWLRHVMLKHAGDPPVSKRTWNRLWSEHQTSNNTFRKIETRRQEMLSGLGLEVRPLEAMDCLKRPWRALFEQFFPDLASQENPIHYPIQVMLRIEDAQYALGQQLAAKTDLAACTLASAELPESLLPKGFAQAWARAVTEKSGPAGRVRPPEGMDRVILGTFLYVLAAWEVAFLEAGYAGKNQGPFVYRGLPRFEGEKYIPPMNSFVEAIKTHFGIRSDKKLAESIEISTRSGSSSEPEESALRRILSWKSGEEVPSLGAVEDLVFKLSGGDWRVGRWIPLSYGLRRFTQELCWEYRREANMPYSSFSGEQDVVAEFQKYQEWYELHKSGFSGWKNSGPCCHSPL